MVIARLMLLQGMAYSTEGVGDNGILVSGKYNFIREQCHGMSEQLAKHSSCNRVIPFLIEGVSDNGYTLVSGKCLFSRVLYAFRFGFNGFFMRQR